MAGFNYARAVNTADRLIKRFGQSGKLLSSTATTGKPTFTPHDVSLVVLDYRVDQIDGERIRANDRQIYVATKGLAVEITPEDRIQDAAGSIYEIIAPVMPLNPAGTTVFYQIQGRS